jgi:hypothetical protein
MVMTTVVSKITGEKMAVPKELIKDVGEFLRFPVIEEHLQRHGKITEEDLYREYVNKMWELALKFFEVKEWKPLLEEAV